MSTPYIGELGATGIAKEVTLGTFVAPSVFIPVHLPMNIGSPDINLLLSKGIRAVPDLVYKAQQGAGLLKSGKFKFEVEPDNGTGQILQGGFGLDTAAEVASYTVQTGINDTIDFNIGASQLTGTLAAGTYAAGLTQADAGSTLCKLIYNAIHGAEGSGTYTVSFSPSTGKFTIARSTGTFVLMFHTGTNTAKSIAPLIGFPTASDQSGSLTYISPTATTPAWGHTFVRQGVAQLPTYSIWVNTNTLTYPQFSGCMVNKLDFDIKANEYVICETDWIGSLYTTGGTSQALSYSPLNPLKFDQAAISVAGSAVLLYKDLKLTIDNKVKCDPVLGGSIYSNVIYTEAFEVTLSATLVVENTTEWTKFLNGTATSFTITINSAQFINGTVPYSLVLTLPNLYYKAAPLPLANGLIEITFQAQGVYSAGSAYTMQAVLTNARVTAY